MLVLCFFFLTIQQIYIFEEAAFVHIFNTENRHFMLVFTVKKAFRFLALHKLYFTSHIYSAKI